MARVIVKGKLENGQQRYSHIGGDWAAFGRYCVVEIFIFQIQH